MNSDNSERLDAEKLAELIDSLMEGGSQHVDIGIGEETKVRTMNSTDCGKKGACAIPTFDFGDAE